MLLVSDKTRLYKFIEYIQPAIGNTSYWIWEEGIVPSGPGAYADNAPVPDISEVINGGMFCAGVTNLALRCDGKRIPFSEGSPSPDYDGGVAAYFTGTFGAGYFSAYTEWFDLAKAKQWAQDTLSGVLLGKGYYGSELWNQGHVAILLPSGYLLQSVPVAGLNWDSHIDSAWSYWTDPNNYGVMVHPENWLEYQQDEDVADWARDAGEPSPGKCVGF